MTPCGLLPCDAEFLNDGVSASLRSVDLSMTQYKAGGTDFIRVLNATEFLVEQQEALVVSQVDTATSLIALNKALGGGWEIREGREFVPPETIERMRHRTNWGEVTDANYDRNKDVFLFPRPQMDTQKPGNQTGGEE